jgi:maltooligosyltrehalose trehalohydrolase
MWLEEFHVDGLRLDAIHAIYDFGARHILQQIKQISADLSDKTGRHIHITGESDQNDPRVLLPADVGGLGLDSQWSDDFHHAIHALLTGEQRGYYSDYGTPLQLAKVLQNPFVYAWDYSQFRGRRYGAPLPADIGGDRFIVCIQNHDQVGNRAKGDRLCTLLNSPPKQRLATCLMLLSPYLPMLFMGEEYGEERPFPFFCSFSSADLTKAVQEGRRREFAHFVTSPDEIPDPASEATFASAVLSWSWPDGSPHAGIRNLHKDLLAARRNWPAMHDTLHRTSRLFGTADNAIIELIRGGTMPEPGRTLQIYFNLSSTNQPIPVPDSTGTVALFSSEDSRYCGSRNDLTTIDALLPYECVVFGPPQWPPKHA